MSGERVQGEMPEPVPRSGAGLSQAELVQLNDELAALARAGLPLDQGLAALAREMSSGRLRRVTAAIAAELQGGRTLPEALERQVGRMPPYYAALLTAGVRSGRLGDVLSTLSVYARTMVDLRLALVGALLYPCIMFAIGMGLVLGVLHGLVPRYEHIFADFKMKLPWLTEWVIFLSHIPLVFFIVPPILLVAFFVLVHLVLSASVAGRRMWARWLYAIPVLGTLIRAARLASFSDLLAILVEHGIPLPEAFELAGAASTDPLAALGSQRVAEDLSRGVPLVQALRARRAVPEVAAWMAGLGEKHNHLAASLHRAAEYYRCQAELRGELLRSALPPIFFIVTAIFTVAVFLLAVLSPLVALLEGLSGGVRGGGGGWWPF